MSAAGAILVLAAMGWSPETTVTHFDPIGDARLIRTDPGNDGVTPPSHVPDLLRVQLSGWLPYDGVADPFTGSIVSGETAPTFRMDVVVRGLVNPPGSIEPFSFDSMRFGPRPIIGFIDLNVDRDRDTGGELGGAAELRFLANVARFATLPDSSISNRAALDSSAFDLIFSQGPQFERTGADFSLVLCGCFEPVILHRSGGNEDDIFEFGETWVLSGRFFERAQGYRNASGMLGGSMPGLYDAPTRVRFHHDTTTDETTISVVYAIDMAGAAMLQGGPVQQINFFADDHVSIQEGVEDLIEAASGPLFEPERTLTRDWDGEDFEDMRDPTDWRVTALIGTPYAVSDERPYVWSDIGFSLQSGDFNGDGFINPQDADALFDEIQRLDGTDDDADGTINGVVVIPDFPVNFNLHDLNYDGTLTTADSPIGSACRADLTSSTDPNDPGYGVPDGLINIDDFFYFLDQFVASNLNVVDLSGSSDPMNPEYGVPDGRINIDDFFYYLDLFVLGCP